MGRESRPDKTSSTHEPSSRPVGKPLLACSAGRLTPRWKRQVESEQAVEDPEERGDAEDRLTDLPERKRLVQVQNEGHQVREALGEVAALALAEDRARIGIDEIFVVLKGRPISRRHRENGGPPGLERQGHVVRVHPRYLLLEPFPKN